MQPARRVTYEGLASTQILFSRDCARIGELYVNERRPLTQPNVVPERALVMFCQTFVFNNNVVRHSTYWTRNVDAVRIHRSVSVSLGACLCITNVANSLPTRVDLIAESIMLPIALQ